VDVKAMVILLAQNASTRGGWRHPTRDVTSRPQPSIKIQDASGSELSVKDQENKRARYDIFSCRNTQV